MKILFVTSQPVLINSSANLRNIALIRGLLDCKHEVDILSFKITQNAANYDVSLQELIKECNLYYVHPLKIHNSMVVTKQKSENLFNNIKTMLRNIYGKFSILDSLALSTKKINFKEIPKVQYDLIISSSDLKSSHYLADEYRRKFGYKNTKWVQYWGDPLSIDINLSSKLPKVLIKKIEKKILGKADKIIYVSPFTLEKQKQNFVSLASKMTFVPIAYTKERFTKIENNREMTFSYLGDYGSRARNIMPLYEAIKTNQEANFKIIGNSDLNLGKIQNLCLEPRLNFEAVKKEEELADVLVCLCNKNGSQIPGKIYHYSGLNKPILVIKDGENDLESYLKEYDEEDKYIFCDNNSESISEKIDFIINNRKELISVPTKAFSPQNIAKEFLKKIDEVVR